MASGTRIRTIDIIGGRRDASGRERGLRSGGSGCGADRCIAAFHRTLGTSSTQHRSQRGRRSGREGRRGIGEGRGAAAEISVSTAAQMSTSVTRPIVTCTPQRSTSALRRRRQSARSGQRLIHLVSLGFERFGQATTMVGMRCTI